MLTSHASSSLRALHLNLFTASSCLLLSVAVSGCLEVNVVLAPDMGGPEGGGYVPPPLDPIGGEPSPSGQVTPPPTGATTPPMGATTPPVGGAPTGGDPLNCSPGAMVGPCEVCGAMGERINPGNDFINCPSLDCDSLIAYRKVRDPSTMIQECRVQRAEPKDQNCQALGICINTLSAYCQTTPEVSEGEQATECMEITGCEGETPMMGVAPREGVSCESDTGTCDAEGRCIPNIPVTCEARFDTYTYNNNNVICQEELDPGSTLTCEFLVNRDGNPYRNGQVFSCDDFCGAAGARCVNAWNDDPNCQRRLNQPQACNVADLNSYFCRCELSLP